jgi:hypothetical protein
MKLTRKSQMNPEKFAGSLNRSIVEPVCRRAVARIQRFNDSTIHAFAP